VGADQIGQVHNDKAWCREWERYRLVRADRDVQNDRPAAAGRSPGAKL
jgi:hypothetical protein